MVDAVSPALGDVHQVRSAYADRVSIGIRACGAGIGAIERAIYSADGAVTPFRSAYANAYANAAARSAPSPATIPVPCATTATWRPLRPRAGSSTAPAARAASSAPGRSEQDKQR